MGLIGRVRRNFHRKLRQSNIYTLMLRRRLLEQLNAPDSQWSNQRLFTFVIPVGPGDARRVSATIKSLKAQYSGQWEAVICPYGGLNPLERQSIAGFKTASRVRVLEHEANDEVGAAKQGVNCAEGDWIGFIDPGNKLHHVAIAWLEFELWRHPNASWLYSDESYRRGAHVEHQFKPDFSIEHLWSRDFTANLSVFRRSRLCEMDLPCAHFANAWRYDMALRFAETAKRSEIFHVSVSLHESSISKGVNQHLAMTPEHHEATRDSIKRCGVKANVSEQGSDLGIPKIELIPQSQPRVSIIIPTRDYADLIIPCIDSLRENTNYENYEVVVVDNQSTERKLLDYLQTESASGRLRVHDYDHPFNHSTMNNEVAFSVQSEYVVALNNDICQFSPGWLEEMVATAQIDPTVAGVGSKLYYPDETIQSAGIFIWSVGAHTTHHMWELESEGYYGRLNALQQIAGVTGGMMLCRRDAFCDIGGFDGVQFPASFNDVDIWLRWRRVGYRAIYNPNVSACHLESKSRGADPKGFAYWETMHRLHGDLLQADPFYNPNLTPNDRRFRPANVCSNEERLLIEIDEEFGSSSVPLANVA